MNPKRIPAQARLIHPSRALGTSNIDIMTIRDLTGRFRTMQRDSNRIGFEFLSVDADVALTFATRALQSDDDSESRRRNRINARDGYDTISRLFTHVDPQYVNAGARKTLEEKLELLKSKLIELGETVQ